MCRPDRDEAGALPRTRRSSAAALPTIRGGDPEVRDAITRAVDELGALGSYQFTVDIAGREITQLAPTTIDLGMQGTIDQTNGLALDAVFGTRLREPDGSAAVTSGGSRIVAGGGYVWGTDNVSGVLEPLADAATVEGIKLADARGCRPAGRGAVRGRVPTPGSRDARRPGDHPLPPIGRG